MKKFLLPALVVIAVVSLAGNVIAYFHYSSSRPLVTVGSEVITRKEYQDALDYQAGAPVLTKMVYSRIVLQAAKAAGVMPTDAEVDERVHAIDRRMPQMLSEANKDATKMMLLKQDMKSDIALENLCIKGVPVTDAEIARFYAQNKPLFAVPTQVKTTLAIADTSTDAATVVTLLKNNTPVDVIARQPRIHVNGVGNYMVHLDALDRDTYRKVGQSIFAMRAGDVKVVPIRLQEKPLYLIFKVQNSDTAQVLPLAQVKDRAARLVKLAKATSPRIELVRLYQSNPPKFDSDRYASYFNEIQNIDTGDKRKTASTN